MSQLREMDVTEVDEVWVNIVGLQYPGQATNLEILCKILGYRTIITLNPVSQI